MHYVYVLTNPSMPGLVKIGMTRRNPTTRTAELTSATGVPTPFVLRHYRLVTDCAAAEAELHYRLRRCRVSAKREFFRVDLPSAIESVDKVCDLYRARQNQTFDVGIGYVLRPRSLSVMNAVVTFASIYLFKHLPISGLIELIALNLLFLLILYSRGLRSTSLAFERGGCAADVVGFVSFVFVMSCFAAVSDGS